MLFFLFRFPVVAILTIIFTYKTVLIILFDVSWKSLKRNYLLYINSDFIYL
jgi:hypothetical protein